MDCGCGECFECEARRVLNLPLPERRAYIANVLATRGMRAREDLENAIYAVWAKAKYKKE